MLSVFKAKESRVLPDYLTQKIEGTACPATYHLHPRRTDFSATSLSEPQISDFLLYTALLQAVITVCVPCSWWCIKQNDGNKLQDARPLVDQALFEYTGHNFYIAVSRRLFRLSSCQWKSES
jgi:hypothetical protein